MNISIEGVVRSANTLYLRRFHIYLDVSQHAIVGQADPNAIMDDHSGDVCNVRVPCMAFTTFNVVDATRIYDSPPIQGTTPVNCEIIANAMYEHSEPRSMITEKVASFCTLPLTFKQPFILLSSQQHLPNLHQQDQRQCCLKLGFHKWKCDEVYKHSAQSPMRDQCPLPVYPVCDSACQHPLFTSGVVTSTATNVEKFCKS